MAIRPAKKNALRAFEAVLVKMLHEFAKPTLAAIPGAAAGAGLSLACDLRVAVDTAKMTTAFAKVGLSGDYGISYFLPYLVGQAKAQGCCLPRR